ncbi:MAG: hydroxyacid dehydrogenase [Rubrivivax sp.]|nr:hydroxyacid dehydrogenase [Rubrivivax sp.]
MLLTHGPAALAQYYGPRALAGLRAVADVRCKDDETPWAMETLVAAAADCDLIVSDRATEAPAALLARLPQLVAWCRCAVDIRNVDVPAASAHGILVTQASAGFMTSVTEWIVGVMIDLARGISDAVQAYRAGQVPPVAMGRELRGSVLGIVGYGQIGRTLAATAQALGMQVLVSDPHAAVGPQGPAQVSMAELLAGSDFVVCLAVATPQTENLFDAAAFAAMRPGAYFVNASRGNLVDEAALRDALDGGRIAGCAMDVGRAPDQMPSSALAAHPRVIATPHIGGLTPPAIEHQSLETVRQVEALLQGRVPEGAVNAEHARRLRAWSGA